MHLLRILTITLLPLAAMNVSAAERWFDQKIVDYGAQLFQKNCAVCHGANAEGTRDWKKTDANGHYPPPPLNGSAHAWHHSIPQLSRSIREGGIKLGGVMPAFGDKLSDQDIISLIAYFQSTWPNENYSVWAGRHMQ